MKETTMTPRAPRSERVFKEFLNKTCSELGVLSVLVVKLKFAFISETSETLICAGVTPYSRAAIVS
jgi:hypothetical protein